jgi:choline kinase
MARKRTEKERKAWSNFKSEILRLAHTLRLKGWRSIPLENSDDIDVERLSGALTNAVYVISPPKALPPPKTTSTSIIFKRTPTKLLLRIYGPQVEHLIDRENELGILRRLARKKIGPRLLGTFRNGRFEEYFASTTLTSADLHVPETSKQIAKRMRELHDGVDLLEREREDGPFVWRNWDKWVERCEHVIRYLDQQILSGRTGTMLSKADSWKERGLVCGVEWPVFRAMVERCRNLLLDYHGGIQAIKEKLVFAHNDVSLLTALVFYLYGI